MFSFVKRLVRQVKKPFKKNQSSNHGCPTVELSQTQSPPPSYNAVILERKHEINQLSIEVKVLERKKVDTLHKFMFAESRYQHGVCELERMQQERVRDVLEGKSKADDRGFQMASKILKEEIVFLGARRSRLRSELAFDTTRLQKAHENLRSFRRRFQNDTAGFRDTVHPRCCSRSQFCCFAIDASFRGKVKRSAYGIHPKSIYVG